jgi:hypothetical protein
MSTNLELKIRALKAEVKELQDSHSALAKHYQEFVKAAVQYLKENAEEE